MPEKPPATSVVQGNGKFQQWNGMAHIGHELHSLIDIG